MELKLNDEIEVIGLSNQICNSLHRAGIHQIKDILKYNLDELAGLRNIGAIAKSELQDWYQDIKDGKIVISDENEPARLESFEPLSKRYFCLEDGEIYEDLLIDELISSARVLNALKNSGYRRLSQIVRLDRDELQAIPKLGEKGCQDFWKFKKRLRLIPVNFTDLVGYEGLTGGEQMFYRVNEGFYDVITISFDDYYRATMQLCNNYYEQCEPGYDFNLTLEDKRLGKFLSKSPVMMVIIQDYLKKKLSKKKYGMEIDGIEAALPIMFQDEKLITCQLNMLIEQHRIAQLLPGRYVCGATHLVNGAAYLPEKERVIFLARLNGESYRKIAGYFGISGATARNRGKKVFTRLNEGPPYFMVDAYMDIFTTYDINPEQWLAIVKDKRYLEYFKLRQYYSSEVDKEKMPFEKMFHDPEMPEAIKRQFSKYE